MKVIKEGKQIGKPAFPRRVECSWCEAVLEIEESDIYQPDKDGFPIKSKYPLTCLTCPCCGRTVEVF